MTLRIAVTLAVVTIMGCEKGYPTESRASEALKPAGGDQVDIEKAASPNDDLALRRSYAATDMKLHECAKPEADGAIAGRGCPSAFVLFGPYLAAPANSDVRLSFEVESADELVVASDVVSELGKNFHGSIEEQAIHPNEKRRLAYRIHLFRAAQGVEARVWVRGEKPIDLRITNFELEVK